MMKKLLSYLRKETATVMTIAAIMAPLVLGMTGVGFDISSWMMGKRDLQTAADSAAIAGAWEIVNNYDDDVDEVALKEAENNGYIPADGGNITIEVTEVDAGTVVTVQLSQNAPLYFSQTFVSNYVTLSSVAAALIDTEPGEFCFLSLDLTADGAISTFGNVDITADGCGMAVNSNSDTALDLNGNSDIDMGDITIVGNYDTGGSVDFNYTSMDTDATAVEDPYADLDIDGDPDVNIDDGCDETDYDVTSAPFVGGAYQLTEGVYCGGLDFSGESDDFVLNPGTYILDEGDFNAFGFSGTITGIGVTIIFTTSSGDYGDVGNFRSTGGDIILKAPLAGEAYEGVVVYQDRNTENCNGAPCDNVMTGNGGIILEGAAYFPSRDVKFGGGTSQDLLAADGGEVCTRIIGLTITMSGNPAMGNDCDDVAVTDPDANTTVRLIL